MNTATFDGKTINCFTVSRGYQTLCTQCVFEPIAPTIAKLANILKKLLRLIPEMSDIDELHAYHFAITVEINNARHCSMLLHNGMINRRPFEQHVGSAGFSIKLDLMQFHACDITDAIGYCHVNNIHP